MNKVHLQNQQIQLRDSDQLKDGVPPQSQKVLILCIILLRDINYIIVFSNEFHIMFSFLIMHMCQL